MEIEKHPISLLPLFIFIFSVSFSLVSELVLAMDVISANQSLSKDQTLISNNGRFVLGFFRPGNSSSNWYIGIWYGTLPGQTIVWVANRESPVANVTASKLMISNDGNLVLFNQIINTIIWSTQARNIPRNSSMAEILDSGNFILRDRSNSSRIFWQSFDYPTDTWLPGSKIGLNKVTGMSLRLISWKNENNPAPGLYSLELDANENQYLTEWNNSIQYWTSGSWNGEYFESVPEIGPKNAYPNSLYRFEYVNNATEAYFTYYILSDSIITRMMIDVSGMIKAFTWLGTTKDWTLFWQEPKNQCDIYAFCGPFASCNDTFVDICRCIKGFTERYSADWGLGHYTGGCVRSTPLQCNKNSSRKADGDRFYTMSNVKLPSNSLSIEEHSLQDCELACINNCSCTAYAYNNGCSLWYGDLINLQDGDGFAGETLYLRLAASEFPRKRKSKGLIIGLVSAGVFVAVSLILIMFPVLRKRRMKKLKRVEGTLMAFTYRELHYITKNFSETLGKGGFGSVFKGSLPDSTEVAVKRLESICQGDKNFRAEVSTIGTIQHLNLIKLIGFCSEKDKKLLVYEYMSMGSLDKHLFGSRSTSLTWKIRYQIALGISRGLLYLHEECRDCIIHCDIKPENILLDELYVPKIADFGLAKLLGRDFSRVLTSMRGTIGYLAPEWIAGMAITTKADVYSYGMMLFEIISGKRNRGREEESDSSHEVESNVSFFPAFAATKLVEGDIPCLLDLIPVGDCDKEELERMLKVALWCVQGDEDLRPSMRQVVQILEGHFNVNMPPIPRPIQVLVQTPNSVSFFSNKPSNELNSVVEVPMSALDKEEEESCIL